MKALSVVSLRSKIKLSYRTQLQERNLTSLDGRRPVLLLRFAQRIIKRQTKKGDFMKSIVMPIPVTIGTVQLSEEIKKQLLREVKETLATEISVKNKKRFTPGDLWNLQRNSRSASDMMRR